MKGLLLARKQLADLLQEEASLCDKLVEEKRMSTDEETKRLAEIDGHKVQITATIARYEAQAEETRKLEASAPKVVANVPGVTVTRNDGEDENGNYRPFKSFGEQLQSVIAAAVAPHRTDVRLVELTKRAAAGLSEGIGQDGGFLVQTDYSSELLKNAMDTGIIAPLCRRFPTKPDSTGIEFPVLEETSRVDGSRWGGIQVYRTNEAGQLTKSKPKFSVQRLPFEKLTGLVALTDEIMNDAPFLASWVKQGFNEEFSVKIDNEIIRGTGAGMMQGVLTSNCLVTVSKESAQPAATFVGMNAIKMFARLFGRSQQNAVWLANQNCFPQIATLTITKDKSDIPLYSPANLIAGQPLGSILGRPVKYVEQCSTLGTKGDIILGDFSRYIIIEKEMKEASSVHVYFDTEQTALRFSVRNNGMPLLKQAITPMNGTDTLTDFVALETRS